MNKIITNCETNESVTVPMTETEIAEFLKRQSDSQAMLEAEQAEAEANATAKAALLNKLGITAEEAQLLLGGN
jgi:hypothetical protein